MKKLKKKYYISAKGFRKADYQKALSTKYNIFFTDNLQEADFFIAPHDNSGLNESQKRELEQARTLGLATKLINDKFLFNSKDPLSLDREYQRTTHNELKDDMQEELEL